MNPLIILAALLAVPIILLTILRVNAAFVFLSLCLGAVLVQFVAGDAATILASPMAAQYVNGRAPNQSSISLVLQLLPVVLTTLIMIHSLKGKSKLVLNIFPAAGASALLALLVVPLLPYGLTSSIVNLPLWHTLTNLQTLIIGASTLFTLLFLWLQRPKRAVEKE